MSNQPLKQEEKCGALRKISVAMKSKDLVLYQQETKRQKRDSLLAKRLLLVFYEHSLICYQFIGSNIKSNIYYTRKNLLPNEEKISSLLGKFSYTTIWHLLAK
jgi:hypothetical protein